MDYGFPGAYQQARTRVKGDSAAVFIHILCSLLLPLGPWNAAAAQCYQFSSGTTASLTINITNLPRPTISSDAHGTVVYNYDLRGLHGNSARVVAGATASSSGDFPVVKESPNESTLSLRITYGPDAGTTFQALVASNDRGPMQAVAFLRAPADPGHPKGLLPEGLPPVLPPPSAWSDTATLAVSLNQQHAYLPASGKIDAIRNCAGAPDLPPPPPQACGPLPEDRFSPAQAAPREPQAVGPFNFRDAFLLEFRLQNERDSAHFSPGHSENFNQNPSPSPAHPFIPDAEDPAVYKSIRWTSLVQEADKLKEMGGFKVAEGRYLNILDKLMGIHGPCSDPVAFMLVHLGEFYLETRDFERAYAMLSRGALARRHRLGELDGDPRDIERLSLMSALTLLGELDLGRGNLDKAEEELAEATDIWNSKSLLHVAAGVNALYYRSLVLERQDKWKKAEELWGQAVKTRSDLAADGVFSRCLKEAAAFYARHGDIQKAAILARSGDGCQVRRYQERERGGGHRRARRSYALRHASIRHGK